MSEDRLRAIRWHGAIAPDIEQCDGADRIVEADGPVLSAGRMVQTKLAFARTPLSGQTEDEFAPSKARMHPWSVIPLSGRVVLDAPSVLVHPFENIRKNGRKVLAGLGLKVDA